MSSTEPLTLTLSEKKILAGVITAIDQAPAIDYEIVARVAGQKYAKNARSASKKLFEKIRAATDASLIDGSGAMDIDGGAGNGASHGVPSGKKKAPANKVVKKGTAKAAGPKSAAPTARASRAKLPDSKLNGSNDNGDDLNGEVLEHDTFKPVKEAPVKRASRSKKKETGSETDEAKDEPSEGFKPVKKAPVKRASQSKKNDSGINEAGSEVGDAKNKPSEGFKPVKQAPAKRVSRSKKNTQDNEGLTDGDDGKVSKPAPKGRASKAKLAPVVMIAAPVEEVLQSIEEGNENALVAGDNGNYQVFDTLIHGPVNGGELASAETNAGQEETFDEYMARFRGVSLETWLEWKKNNPYAEYDTGHRAITPQAHYS